MMFYVWFRVSFDTQYVLVIVSRYRVILDMFYVTFQGYRFGSPYGYLRTAKVSGNVELRLGIFS